MGKYYKVSVNEKHIFEIQSEDLLQLNKVKTAKHQLHLIKDETSYRVTVVKADYPDKTFQLRVNDRDYKIVIEDEFDQLVAQMGLEDETTLKVNNVTAPMPGLVLEVSATIGQAVKQGDVLLILEAMKMENVIKSAGEGIVKTIHVEQGTAVDKGALLIELE